MTPRSPGQWHPLALVAAAAGLVAIGAGGTWLALGGRSASPASESAEWTAAAAAESAPTSAGGTAVVLAPGILRRADLEIVEARTGPGGGELRVPATVAPDGYRQVVVTAAAAGRLVAVLVEAGQAVRRGDAIARLHSPDVAEAQRDYVTAQAELTVWERQLARLDRLVSIGAASRQEQEAAESQRVRLLSEKESARARLLQLGRSPEALAKLTSTDDVDATVVVVSPADGTVTRRAANPGQNVDGTTELVTIVDLSSVWIVGDVYERDLARVPVGGTATIASAAFPRDRIQGRVSYVDPQVAADTRTARVRVEVPNPGGRLRLGMFVEMTVAVQAEQVVLVPRASVQTIDDTDVVYVADPVQAGRFTERSVRLGAPAGTDVEIAAGLVSGERVVARGSFLLRSERDRQNLAAPAPAPAPVPIEPSGGQPPRVASPFTVAVSVNAVGFSPEEIVVPAGRPVRLVFTRTVQETCATEVAVPAAGIKVALPLNQPVTVDLPARSSGSIAFACGMNMLRGQIVVR